MAASRLIPQASCHSINNSWKLVRPFSLRIRAASFMVHYTLGRFDCAGRPPTLRLVFYRTMVGREPVRDWLRELTQVDRKTVSVGLKTAQYGWPLGMPLVRKLEPGLWEVRSQISDGVARVIFTVDDDVMVLLHGFVKKSQEMPLEDLRTTRQRLADLRGG